MITKISDITFTNNEVLITSNKLEVKGVLKWFKDKVTEEVDQFIENFKFKTLDFPSSLKKNENAKLILQSNISKEIENC